MRKVDRGLITPPPSSGGGGGVDLGNNDGLGTADMTRGGGALSFKRRADGQLHVKEMTWSRPSPYINTQSAASISIPTTFTILSLKERRARRERCMVKDTTTTTLLHITTTTTLFHITTTTLLLPVIITLLHHLPTAMKSMKIVYVV
ncbi:hypothetical protein L1987_10170 [Smallanthus sonchifolius]|uniref:Uncharacterized protein n=1 Tax=Smallanthus sonchifolius TaxID=185202 RepID=A0ACB9JRC7_9ASTR|nr:hypothetical protein L1987_10170 [Smallanthus sonchifolius]